MQKSNFKSERPKTSDQEDHAKHLYPQYSPIHSLKLEMHPIQTIQRERETSKFKSITSTQNFKNTINDNDDNLIIAEYSKKISCSEINSSKDIQNNSFVSAFDKCDSDDSKSISDSLEDRKINLKRINDLVKKFVTKLRLSSNLRKIDIFSNNVKAINDKSSYFLDDQYESNSFFSKFNFLKTLINFCKILLRKPRTFHPYKNFKTIWDLLHLVLIIFWFFYNPLLVSFDEVRRNQLHGVLKNFFFVFVSCDIAFNLNTAYFRKGFLEKRRIFILKRYLKYSFVLDTISLFPLFLFLNFYEEIPFEDNLNLLPLCFFFRLKHFKRIYQKILEKFMLKEKFENLIGLVKILFISILVAHIFACIWHRSAYVSNLVNNGFEMNWVIKIGSQTKEWKSRYLYSFYWAIVTMMTVGYGDITPSNDMEYLLAIITVIFGCAVYAYNINSFGIILNDMNKDDSDFKHDLNIINQFMKRKKINQNLQMKIRDYLKYISKEENSRNIDEEQNIINRLSHNLKDQLLLESYGSVIKNYSIFWSNFSFNTLKKLVGIIKDYHYLPDDVIFKEGEYENPTIYFIIKGEIELYFESKKLNEDLIIKTLKPGECFGELAFFGNKPRCCSARSKDFTKLYAIKRDDFIGILEKNDEDFERFSALVDEMNLYGNYNNLRTHCYLCMEKNHISLNCPKAHFFFDREKIIKTFEFSTAQERVKEYKRRENKRQVINLNYLKMTVNEFNRKMDTLKKIQETQELKSIINDSSYEMSKQGHADRNSIIYSLLTRDEEREKDTETIANEIEVHTHYENELLEIKERDANEETSHSSDLNENYTDNDQTIKEPSNRRKRVKLNYKNYKASSQAIAAASTSFSSFFINEEMNASRKKDFVKDYFERLKNFKNYFPESNSSELVELLNNKTFVKRTLILKNSKRYRLILQQLSRYTLFCDELIKKTPKYYNFTMFDARKRKVQKRLSFFVKKMNSFVNLRKKLKENFKFEFIKYLKKCFGLI